MLSSPLVAIIFTIVVIDTVIISISTQLCKRESEREMDGGWVGGGEREGRGIEIGVVGLLCRMGIINHIRLYSYVG